MSIVVSGLAIWLLAESVDVSAAASVLRATNQSLLVLALATLTASIVCRAVRWRAVLPAIEGQPAPSVLMLAGIFCVGYLANSVLPLRAGEPIRAAVLAAHSRADAARVLGSIGLERILDAMALGVVMVGTAAALRAPSWLTTSGLVVLALATMVLGAIIVIGHTGILERAHRQAHSVLRPLLGVLARVAEGARG
ncbi:MAG: lysylphosphatidylglycerol synthase transmembrane domain-containing protein, partial [Chloroflexota bacterium]